MPGEQLSTKIRQFVDRAALQVREAVALICERWVIHRLVHRAVRRVIRRVVGRVAHQVHPIGREKIALIAIIYHKLFVNIFRIRLIFI